MSAPFIVSLQIGLPKSVEFSFTGTPNQRSWETGFLKDSVDGPIWMGSLNLAGDGQADLVHHGGPQKAVCVYPASHYPYWREALKLPELATDGMGGSGGLGGFGAFGENFTVDGVTESDVCIGDRWQIGAAVVQVSQPRQPCWKLARRWGVKDLARLVQQNGKTGWYFRVLAEGNVARGDWLKLIERPHPQWTIAAANRLMHHDKTDLESAARLAQVPELSDNWQATLKKRIEADIEPNEKLRLDGEK